MPSIFSFSPLQVDTEVGFGERAAHALNSFFYTQQSANHGMIVLQQQL
jgi:hypothetical protein